MGVWKEELKKNIKKYHIESVVLMLLIIRLLSGIFFTENASAVNDSVEAVKEAYSEFVDEYEGELSEIFGDRLAQMNAQQQEAEDTLVQLALGVEDGILRQKDYVEGLLRYREVLTQTEITNVLNNQVNYMRENPEQRYFMYTNGWVSLFQNMKLDYMYLIVLLLVMIPLFVREYETKMDVLNQLSKKGQGTLYFAKIAFAMMFCVVTALLFFVTDLLAIQLRFGISHLDYPLQSLHIFMENTSKVTIGQYLWMSFFVMVMGGLLASVCMIVITLLMKKMIPSIIVFLAGLLLPQYVFDEHKLAKIPNLTTLFTRKGYVVGIRSEASAAPCFMDMETIRIHLFVYCLSVLGLVLIGFLIYCKKGRLLCLGTLLFLTGCGDIQTDAVGCNWSNINMVIANDTYVIDGSDNPTVMTENGSAFLLHDAFYGCESYTVQLGYLSEDELYYLKVYAEQNAFELCKTNLQTFETISIYKEMGDTIVGYPYLRELKKADRTEQEQIDAFYVNGDTILLYRENRLYRVNRKNGKKSLLLPGVVKECAFLGDTLFYINDCYELFCMDLKHGEKEKMCDFLVNKVFVSGTTLYMESLESAIYTFETVSGEMKEIQKDTEKLMCVDERYLYHLSEENVLNIVTLADGKRQGIETEGPIMEVESYRNGECIYLYVYKNSNAELIILTPEV